MHAVTGKKTLQRASPLSWTGIIQRPVQRGAIRCPSFPLSSEWVCTAFVEYRPSTDDMNILLFAGRWTDADADGRTADEKEMPKTNSKSERREGGMQLCTKRNGPESVSYCPFPPSFLPSLSPSREESKWRLNGCSPIAAAASLQIEVAASEEVHPFPRHGEGELSRVNASKLATSNSFKSRSFFCLFGMTLRSPRVLHEKPMD